MSSVSTSLLAQPSHRVSNVPELGFMSDLEGSNFMSCAQVAYQAQ